MKTKYKIIKKCFVGDVGDIIEVEWDSIDGASWHNLSKKTGGCPFIETDCIKPWKG